MDERDKKYLDALVHLMKSTKTELKKQKGGWFKELSNNIPLVLVMVLGSFAGTGYALMNLTPLGNFVLPISAGVALTTGVAIPKTLHTIFEKSMGKIGRSYAKHNLNKYFKAMIDFLDSKDCKKLLSNPNNIHNLSENQKQNIKNQMHFYTKNLHTASKKLIFNKVTKRTAKDLNAITKLVEKIKDNTNKEAKLVKQVQKILDKNSKFVSPWCNLYNQCISNAKKLFNFLHEWDDNYEVPEVALINPSYLSEKVATLLGKENSINQKNEKSLEIDLQFETNKNKTKSLSSFDELKSYLLKKHNKENKETKSIFNDMDLGI